MQKVRCRDKGTKQRPGVLFIHLITIITIFFLQEHLIAGKPAGRPLQDAVIFSLFNTLQYIGS